MVNFVKFEVIFLVYLVIVVTGVKYSRENEGYPVGLLADCPYSWKPAIVKPKSLRNLYVSVMNKDYIQARKYDYYHIGNLAKDPDIDFKKKTFLYCGGYLDSTTLPFGWALGKAYKDLGYNVILLDTLDFTARIYPDASRLIRPIGKHVAQMLANLTSRGLDPKKLELVGLSLGSHTMSFIAKNYQKITGRNISSLTSLDAAGPCFRHLGPQQRLDPSDADFVLAIVTNMDGFGMATPLGHVTFYANGGEYQPSEIPWFPCEIVCSHIRGYILWLSALSNPGTFIAMRCNSIQEIRDGDCFDSKPMVTNTMDLFTDRSKPGIYYLKTNNLFPYGLGKKGLKKDKYGTLEASRYFNLSDVYQAR